MRGQWVRVRRPQPGGSVLRPVAVAALAQRLPAEAVDELTDGLTETYHHHLTGGLDPDTAARTAVAEFGETDLIVAAFVQQSPGRKAAHALLRSGPLVGACWAAVLITAPTWTSSIPTVVRIGTGVALTAVVALLALAATARHSYRRTRLTIVTGLPRRHVMRQQPPCTVGTQPVRQGVHDLPAFHAPPDAHPASPQGSTASVTATRRRTGSVGYGARDAHVVVTSARDVPFLPTASAYPPGPFQTSASPAPASRRGSTPTRADTGWCCPATRPGQARASCLGW
jgi:hypothetical protein